MLNSTKTNHKTLLTAVLIVVPAAAAILTHVNEGVLFRLIFTGGHNVYGIRFADLPGGKAFAEHMAIINWSSHLTQLQMIVQFICAVVLDFRHCIWVTACLVVVNIGIFGTGEHVDLNDPMQFVSTGYGVHRCILFKSVWVIVVGILGLFLTWCLDRERRASWARPA